MAAAAVVRLAQRIGDDYGGVLAPWPELAWYGISKRRTPQDMVLRGAWRPKALVASVAVGIGLERAAIRHANVVRLLLA
jgi:hypothetical protein